MPIGTRVNVLNNMTGEEYEIDAFLVIGADGSNSVVRATMTTLATLSASSAAAAQSTTTSSNGSRYCGEMCYRGVVSLENDSKAAKALKSALDRDQVEQNLMNIEYGHGLRLSVGVMDRDGRVGYWWVKQSMQEVSDTNTRQQNCTWPEPLKTLHDETESSSCYVHPIRDRPSTLPWSQGHRALIGDGMSSLFISSLQ